MPYKPKMTPKAASRARATGKAQAQTRRQIMKPGRMNESGTAGYAVAKVAGAVLKNVAKGSSKAKPVSRTSAASGKRGMTAKEVRQVREGRIDDAVNYGEYRGWHTGATPNLRGVGGTRLSPALKRSKAASKKAAASKAASNQMAKAMTKRGSGGSRKPSAVVKPSSGRASAKARPNPKPRRGNQR